MFRFQYGDRSKIPSNLHKEAKMKDRFFDALFCERCGMDLSKSARTMSWFTEQTICLDCSSAEKVIKDKLRNSGRGDMEGCGYVPEV